MRCISLDNPQCSLGLAAHGSLGGFCQYGHWLVKDYLLSVCELNDCHQSQLVQEVYCRFPDGYFPRWFFSRKDVSRKVVSRMVIFPDRMFPGKTIPGWSLSRKVVSRVVIFPDDYETFPGKTS